MSDDENILEEANRIVSDERERDYGHPAVNFEQTAALWRAAFGWNVTPHHVAYAMVLLKLSRQMHKPQRDNLVDMAGYVRTAEKIDEYFDERDAIEDAQKHIAEVP